MTITAGVGGSICEKDTPRARSSIKSTTPPSLPRCTFIIWPIGSPAPNCGLDVGTHGVVPVLHRVKPGLRVGHTRRIGHGHVTTRLRIGLPGILHDPADRPLGPGAEVVKAGVPAGHLAPTVDVHDVVAEAAGGIEIGQAQPVADFVGHDAGSNWLKRWPISRSVPIVTGGSSGSGLLRSVAWW